MRLEIIIKGYLWENGDGSLTRTFEVQIRHEKKFTRLNMYKIRILQEIFQQQRRKFELVIFYYKLSKLQYQSNFRAFN